MCSPIPPPAVSHSSRRQLNESNVTLNHTQTSTVTTATKPFHPDSGHATTPTPVRAHLHRPGTPCTPVECFTPSHKPNATVSPQSPTGRETYRLSEHDAAAHGHKLGGDEKTTLEADRVSRDRPSTQAGQHTSQNGLGQSVINITHHHQQQQSASAIDVSAVSGGVFYAPTICTSDTGASEPFRLVEHAEFDRAFSPQSAANQNSRDPLHMIFHQQCSPPEKVTVATSSHRKTPSDFHQPVGPRKVRAVWGTPNRSNRSHSVCSPPSTTTNVNRNGQQLDISNEEKKIGSKRPQKKFTYTSDETDSIFIRDISINSGSPLPTSDENEDVKSLAHRSMVDLPGNYPRRTRIKSPPTRALVNKTSRVPSDNRAPDLLYKLKQEDPESTDVNETDPGDDLCSPSEHPRACELDCTNHASSTPLRTRWKRSSERRLSDTRPHRSSSRRVYRSSRSKKREESTPVFYYPTGGIYPQPVRAEHCVVPVMYPVESSASPRQMYAIHCDPYCPQSSWIHPPHHHLPPQHPLTVIPPNPFVSPSQYYVSPVHHAHTQIVGSLVNSTSVPQMPVDPEYRQTNPSYATIPRTISSGQDPNNMVQHTNNTVEHNTCSSKKPDESITIDSQTVNRIRPDSTQPTDGDGNKRTPDEALPTRSPDVNNSKHQRAQSFFVSIESGKVGSQPAFGLRGPSLRSTSLVRRRKIKPKLPTTDDLSQVTSSTGPSQTRVEGNESDFDQVKSKPNGTNEGSDSGKNSNSEKCPKPVTETSNTVTERSAPVTSSPRPLVRTHSSESNIPLKLSIVTGQIEKREQRRELERQRREAIFQAYLNRKTSASSDRETDNSLPSSASLSQNSLVKRKTPRITERARLTDSSPKQAHKQRSSLLARRPASLSRPTINSTREVNGEIKGQARDELSLLRIKSPTSADLPPVGPNQMEPKLFVELKSKSNRRVISNALSHCCLAGPVNEEAKHAALEALGCSDGKHFMILLRSQCQYGGLYSYSATEDQAVRVSGNGPKKINNNMVAHYYKYDSGSKRFSEITSTSHLSTVVDAVQLHGRTRNRLTSGSAVV
ncbi:Calmodulin-regulated spectrin-associated protein 1-B [Fasciola gigantica]|uniref:Calmodulin-regulated spectrin-associated protein 1-B n=1 Tax=Fasciola gigantica TaxID=46835 RepID=A0A504YJM2_FASGI|nr:Calmodulin-regulated spectrin-associated protein 1-B [Fasciola gigantica]